MTANNRIRVGTAQIFALGLALTFAAALELASVSGAAADEAATWVGTWAASPQATWHGDFPLPTLLPYNLWNQTVRQVVRVSLGGPSVRVVLSNEYGVQPLTIDAVHVALAGTGASIVEGTDHELTFSGSKTVTIPPGAPMVSDPVAIKVPARGDLAVSFFVSAPTPIDTFHWDAEQTGFIVGGNAISAVALDSPTKTTTRIFLSDVLVEAPAGARSVVAFGDSITDGAASGVDQNARWSDFLADNLAPLNVAVLNAGISGARLLQSKMGENAMARFDRDVLAKPNIGAVVVLLGINDIAWPGQTFAPNDPFLTRDELVAGYRQLLVRAHMRGIRVVVGTLTPFRNALKGSPLEGYYSDRRNKLRKEVNDWIRSSGEFDAVVDLDKLVQAPKSPDDILDAYQADHLHLSAAGNKLVADALTPHILFGEK